MTRTSILMASSIAALAIAGGTASAAGGPKITVGTGCAVQCVKKAVGRPRPRRRRRSS